jgi:hypothetical protein
VTDYPDRELVENMEYNVKMNVPDYQRDRLNVQVPSFMTTALLGFDLDG